MGFDSSENKRLSCSLVALVIVAYLAWTAGAHALPVYEDPSGSSIFLATTEIPILRPTVHRQLKMLNYGDL
jgi:hypothetical protein